MAKSEKTVRLLRRLEKRLRRSAKNRARTEFRQAYVDTANLIHRLIPRSSPSSGSSREA